jgi:hypothetical protein
MAAVGRPTTARRSDSDGASSRGSAHAELLGDVRGDAGVGGRGGGEHRDVRGQGGKQRPDPPVVGPEVVAPVGDAVRLVDHDQPGRLHQARQHIVAEPGVVQPLGADEQDVDRAVADLGVHLLPLLQVRRVDRPRMDARARRGVDLVAHQREQRRDDDRRAGAAGPQQRGRDEVHRRLAPAGPLDHQRSAPLRDEGADRRPLVVPQPRVLAGEGPQVLLGRRAQFVVRHGSSAIKNRRPPWHRLASIA